MKHRKRFFLLVLTLIQISIIWPVYPLVSSIQPTVFGLPFSFFWVVLMLVASFFVLLWYYLTDPNNTHDSSKTSF